MQYLDLRESRTHGSLHFPVGFYHVGPRHPRYSMDFHWHVECEIIRVLEGSLHLTIDDEILDARAGDLLFVNSGALHAGTPEGCVYECAVFDLGRLLRRELPRAAELAEGTLRVTSRLPAESALLRDAEDLFAEISGRGPGFELMAQGALCRILGRILRSGRYTEGIPKSRQYRRILQFKRSLQMIEEGYHSQLTLAQLSEAAGMSPKYFCRFFRQMTRRTPVDYLNFYRVEQACHRLLTTGLSVTEIAYECGFNDLSYFIRIFRKHKGVSPTKYLSA